MRLRKIEPIGAKVKKQRVCAYARVSTDSIEQGESFENQVITYEKLIKSNPEYEFVEVYADQGISGTSENRPEFQRMMEDCRNGKIDLIITKSISRFARNTTIVLNYTRELKQLGIGSVQMYHIEEDHEPIIDIETWKAVQAELERRAQYCVDHFTNAYSQKSETNPFYAKIICGNCGNIYSRVKYTTKAGTAITKWRCGSCNKTNGHKICTNRYVTDETFTKLFVMSWNEIVEHQAEYKERWQESIKGDDVLLRYKTRLVMKHVAAGPIKEFEPELMMAVMDHITVFEDGRLQILFYDGTEFEVETE